MWGTSGARLLRGQVCLCVRRRLLDALCVRLRGVGRLLRGGALRVCIKRRSVRLADASSL